MNEPTQQADANNQSAPGQPDTIDAESGSFQGAEAVLADLGDADRAAWIEKAFDYRGNVLLELTDGRGMEGYLFDRRGSGASLAVRFWPADDSAPITIAVTEIVRLRFSGRDTAEGKSWEHWVKKYHDKKAAGQEASLYDEPLDHHETRAANADA